MEATSKYLVYNWLVLIEIKFYIFSKLNWKKNKFIIVKILKFYSKIYITNYKKISKTAATKLFNLV